MCIKILERSATASASIAYQPNLNPKTELMQVEKLVEYCPPIVVKKPQNTSHTLQFLALIREHIFGARL
jgi:hypothetical protein